MYVNSRRIPLNVLPRAVQKSAVLVIVLTVCAVVFAPTRGDSAPASVDVNRRVLELRTLHREIPHTSPWQVGAAGRSLRPAVYLGRNTYLSFEPAMPRAFGSTLRFPRDLELSAHLLHADPQIGLNLVRVDRQGYEATGWQEPERTVLAENFDYNQRGKGVDLIGYGADFDRGLRRHTVFVEGMRAARFPEIAGHWARELPVLQFSGWTPGIRAGDLLFTGSELVAIVLRFDPNDRYGFALPASMIAGYVHRVLAVDADKPARTKDAEKASRAKDVENIARGKAALAQVDVSVICDPGFRGEAISSPAARTYYGLKPGSEGAVLVTRVMPYLRVLRDRLRTGDVIVGVNGRRLGPGGTFADSRFGELPITALLGFNAGRPTSPGTVVKLEVSRDRQLRTVEFELHPHQPAYVRVPTRFNRPAYLITGGLVLVELSEEYLSELQSPAPPRLEFLAREHRLDDQPEGSRYVILDRILPVEFNAAYSGTAGPLLVQSLNGVAVRSLTHLKTMMQDQLKAGEDLAFGLEGGRLIVLPGDDHGTALNAADARVRARHGIPFLQANLDRAGDDEASTD